MALVGTREMLTSPGIYRALLSGRGPGARRRSVGLHERLGGAPARAREGALRLVPVTLCAAPKHKLPSATLAWLGFWRWREDLALAWRNMFTVVCCVRQLHAHAHAHAQAHAQAQAHAHAHVTRCACMHMHMSHVVHACACACACTCKRLTQAEAAATSEQRKRTRRSGTSRLY